MRRPKHGRGLRLLNRPTKDLTMKRFHVHAHVENLQASVAFYACCGPTTRGKPVGVAVKSSSSCC